MDNGSNPVGNEGDILDSFDFERFWYVLKRSKIWLLGFIILTTLSAYLYVRYTKPIYKSESVIKLGFKSEANVLGITNLLNTNELNSMTGEIELIRSKLFLSKVSEIADIDVTYGVYGRYLTSERYKNSPFNVSYKILNPKYFDYTFDLEFIDDNLFSLTYNKNGEDVSETYEFGSEILTKNFNLFVTKSADFNQTDGLKFFFRINSEDRQISYLKSAIEVQPQNINASTLSVAFKDHNRIKARDIVNIIDTLYLNYTKEVKNQAIRQKIDFLDVLIDSTEQKLEVYENYFEEFTIENRTVNLDADLGKTIEQLYYLDTQRFSLKNKLSEIDLLTTMIMENRPLIINPIFMESIPKSLSSQLSQYTQNRSELASKLKTYNEKSLIVSQYTKQINNSKTSLLQLIKAYKGSVDETLGFIDERRRFLESNLYQFPSMGTEYGKNRRLYNLQEGFIKALLQSKIELEITKAGTVTSSVILSSASLPSSPIRPQKILIISAGFVLGVVISVLFLLTRYLAHNKVAGIKELEKLINVPVIGSVPKYSQEELDETALVVRENSKTSLSEALRTIRTNMDYINLENGKTQTISISSTVSGEGKTFIAANLGAIISLTKQKVCIVDIDMRRPKVHLAFGGDSSENGVSTILAGKSTLDESIQKSEQINNLHYIAAGPIPPNPSELLLQDKFEELFNELKRRYDTVILDTPPVGLVTDGRLVMRKCEIQLYVVRADYSKRSYTKVLNDLKNSGQFSHLTAILNSVDSTPGYGYGYGYYLEDDKKYRIKQRKKAKL